MNTSPEERALRPLPNLIFASRWLQLPLYLGLILAQDALIPCRTISGIAIRGIPCTTRAWPVAASRDCGNEVLKGHSSWTSLSLRDHGLLFRWKTSPRLDLTELGSERETDALRR